MPQTSGQLNLLNFGGFRVWVCLVHNRQWGWTEALSPANILGGSWLAISRVVSRVTIVITYIRRLTTPLITTHEPPSTDLHLGFSRHTLS